MLDSQKVCKSISGSVQFYVRVFVIIIYFQFMAGAVSSARADCKIDKVLYSIGDMLDFYPAKIVEVGNGGVFVANFLFCHSILLCGLCRDLFDGSVGVRQPYFVDIM